MRKPTLRVGLVAILVLAALCVTLAVALLGWRWAGSNRADLAQWLMAGAAVATLFAAIGAAVFAGAAFTVELNREQRFLDAERRSQAERVAAWGLVASKAFSRSGKVHLAPELYLRNATDLPVYDAHVRLRVLFTLGGEMYETSRQVTYPVLPPSGAAPQIDGVEEITHSLSQAFLDQDGDRKNAAWDEALSVVETTLQFRDTGNRTWRRTASGRLIGPVTASD